VTLAYSLIQQGAPLPKEYDPDTEILSGAAGAGNVAGVCETIQRIGSPNKLAQPAHRAMIVAFDRGQVGSLDALIRAGADVNMTDDKGRTVLHQPSLGGD